MAIKLNTATNNNFTDYLNKKYNIELQFKNVDNESVNKTIYSLKLETRSGLNGISMKLLKQLKMY